MPLYLLGNLCGRGTRLDEIDPRFERIFIHELERSCRQSDCAFHRVGVSGEKSFILFQGIFSRLIRKIHCDKSVTESLEKGKDHGSGLFREVALT